jgi:hypothetical protein
MPIQGNIGPIMRKPDPQKTHLRSPVPQRDEKGVMILGSRMTREDLISAPSVGRPRRSEITSRHHRHQPSGNRPRLRSRYRQDTMQLHMEPRNEPAALEARRLPEVVREKVGNEGRERD